MRRRRMFAIGAVGGAVLIAIIIAVVASGGGGGSPQAVPTTPQVTQPVTPTPTPTPTPTTTAQTTPTETIHVTLPDGVSLKEGDQGDAVVQLQKALAALGFDVGTPDGDFGQATKDAVIAFQTQHNLTPDGVVGAETAKAINDAIASSAG